MAYIGRNIEYGAFSKQTLAADGSTVSFSLNEGVTDAKNLLVLNNGVMQEPDVAYTAAGTTLTFTSAPLNGVAVWVIYLGQDLGLSTSRDTINYQNAVGNGSTTTVTLTSVGTTSNIIVTLNGVVQTPGTDFQVSGSTLTFSTAPFNNSAIGIHYLNSKATLPVPASGSIEQSDIANSGVLPAWDGSALTGIVEVTSAQIMEMQNNIALLNFLRANDVTAKRTSMLNGFQDQFRTEDGIVPFNGVAAVGALEDASSSEHTITAVGNVALSTTQTKIGTHSIYSNDTDGAGLTVDASDASWDSGTNSFTWEAWIRTVDKTKTQEIISFYGSGSGELGENTLMRIHGSSIKAKIGGQELVSGATISNNTWHHICFERTSTTQFYLYVDGVGTASSGFSSHSIATNSVTIANHKVDGGDNTENFDGYIDEVRISNVARYSGTNFTPSTTAFTSDANTQLLIHGDAVTGTPGTGSSQLTYSNNTYTNKSASHDLSIMTKGTNDLSEVDSPSSAPSKGHIEALVDDAIIGTTIISDASKWAGNGTSHVTFSGNDIKVNTGDKQIYVPTAVTGDFEVTGTWYGSTGTNSTGQNVARGFALGFYATGETYTDALDTDNMTQVWYYDAPNQGSGSGDSFGYAQASQGSFTPNNGDTFKFCRISGTFYWYFADTLRHTWSQTYTGTGHIILNWSGVTNIEIKNLQWVTDQSSITYSNINTDVIGEMSRDGGTTWSPATLRRVDKVIAGSNYDVFMGDVDFTGDPSGTNIKGRIKTANQTQVTVKGMAVNWL